MLTAREARNAVLANASFDRKVELYNQVTSIIKKAVENKDSRFVINEEQHLVLNSELLEKGYKQVHIGTNPFLISFNGPVYNYSFEGE